MIIVPMEYAVALTTHVEGQYSAQWSFSSY
jgi:hypothetical protein